MILPVLLGGRNGRLDGCKGFENPVSVCSAPGNRPRVTGRQLDLGPFEMQFCPTTKYVADGLILSRDLGLGLTGLLVHPQAHRERLARRQIPLSHLAPRRPFVSHLVHVFLRHILLLKIYRLLSSLPSQQICYSRAVFYEKSVLQAIICRRRGWRDAACDPVQPPSVPRGQPGRCLPRRIRRSGTDIRWDCPPSNQSSSAALCR